MSMRVVDNEGTRNRIKEIMDERHLTPRQIQCALGLDSSQAVYKWINPKSKTIPSLDSLVQFANFLDCTLEDILVFKEYDE